ncbi:phosphoribosylanthranilate isomerase [Rhizobiales bacterium TNE-4]|nr:phosphoribosylanthranilate isomerase [Rhizobiales bacterium TNE-4]MBV1826157.1 phosphoribosylanthranilate isomerase [Rhizobiales bacterium TNE-4]
MQPIVKICGLKTPETLAAALDAGADMVGFVFFPKSPRHIDLATAEVLGRQAQGKALKVALTVDADDAALAAIVAALNPDLLQLHGHESPERVAAIRARFGLPVMKAIGVAHADDLKDVQAFAAVADRLLFDAKPPKDAAHPGGNGLAFDWSLLTGLDLSIPSMVSGGLDPANVAEALRRTRAQGVDVSSGVETAPGQKDPAKITAFVRAAKGKD